MHYYMYQNGKTLEISETSYELWYNKNANKYQLPTFEVSDGKYVYSIETMYQGAIGTGEEALPFLLIMFRDKLVINSEGVKQKNKKDLIEYYATFEELKENYEKLKLKLESKK